MFLARQPFLYLDRTGTRVSEAVLATLEGYLKIFLMHVIGKPMFNFFKNSDMDLENFHIILSYILFSSLKTHVFEKQI